MTLETALVDYLRIMLEHDRIYPHQVSRTNSTWPALTYYRASTDHEHTLSGSAGYAWADIAIDVWGPVYTEVIDTAESVRQALQGAHSVRWDGVGIAAVVLDGESDSVERPSDGSGTWWYSRSLDFRVMYMESVPPAQVSIFHYMGTGGITLGSSAEISGPGE